MADIIIMGLVPVYMITFLYIFVLYSNQISKTPIYYLWQSLLIGMIIIPMMLLSNIKVLAKRQKLLEVK